MLIKKRRQNDYLSIEIEDGMEWNAELFETKWEEDEHDEGRLFPMFWFMLSSLIKVCFLLFGFSISSISFSPSPSLFLFFSSSIAVCVLILWRIKKQYIITIARIAHNVELVDACLVVFSKQLNNTSQVFSVFFVIFFAVDELTWKEGMHWLLTLIWMSWLLLVEKQNRFFYIRNEKKLLFYSMFTLSKSSIFDGNNVILSHIH